MKRILVGFIMDGKSGGVDHYLLHFLDAVKDEHVRIDFLTNEIDSKLKEKLQMYHCRIFAVPNLKHPFAQFCRIGKILKKYRYDTVYLNLSTAIDCVAACSAWYQRVPKRVLHSHACGIDCENQIKRKIYTWFHRVCRLFLYRFGTDYYGASENAGLWIFPERIVKSEKFQVILSGIEKEKYQYDPEIRSEVRKEQNLSIDGNESFVIGHIGNFCYVKNYEFLLSIFENVVKREQNALLLLVGDGDRRRKVEEKVREAGLAKHVRFLGWRRDIPHLVQAMDVFVLPSYFEGLSIAALEAQSAFVPCVLSDTVPKEVRVTDICRFVSLKKDAGEWAEIILNQRACDRETNHFLENAKVFDLRAQREMLKQIP